MKKIILLFIVSFIFIPSASAQTVTASPSGSVLSPTLKIDKQIQNLKDKIANKVAEINKKDKKAYAGIISKNEGGIVYFTNKDNLEMEAKIDDVVSKIYAISGATAKEIKPSDLEAGDYVIVSGILSGKTIEANSIYKDENYFVKTGKISEVNKTDYYIKVVTSDKDNLTIDIETYTKIKLLNIKSLEVERSGFSKIKEGDTIHFVYKKPIETKEKNRYSAQTILVIPQEYFIK